MKKTAVGVAIFIGVVILILAIVPFAIDLNKHKGTILTQIKTYYEQAGGFSEYQAHDPDRPGRRDQRPSHFR